MAFTEEQINATCAAMGWERTGVFATEDELAQSRAWQREMADAPLVKVHGVWLTDAAEELFKKRIDSLAFAHGLPDRGEDHYGLIVTGEFTTNKAEGNTLKTDNESEE